MKKNILAMLLVLATLSLQAQQRIKAYVNAGTVLSQVEGDELKGFNHLGFCGGVGALAHLDDYNRWALTIETDYSCRGIYNMKSSSDNLYNIKLNLHYIDIPVTLLFRDPYGGIQIGLGLAYSRLVAQPHGNVTYNPNHFIPDSSDMTFLKNDLSPVAEIRFSVWENLKLSIRYQHSVIPVKKGWTFHDRNESWSNDCYNASVAIRLLWQFGEEENKKMRRKRR